MNPGYFNPGPSTHDTKHKTQAIVFAYDLILVTFLHLPQLSGRSTVINKGELWPDLVFLLMFLRR